MNPLPVAYRELLVLARRPALHWLRATAALLTAAVGLGIVLVRLGAGATPDAVGRPLFLLLSWCAGALCLLAGPVLMADSIAEEKRAGTLGLLRLSNLHSYDIVAGKLAGLALPAMHGLLAILPVMTVGFFLGGVSGGEFARTGLALLNLLFFSMALAALCSAAFTSGRRALAMSLGCLLFSAGLFALLERGVPWVVEWEDFALALAAPVAALPAAWESSVTCPGRFGRLLGLTHAAGWSCLLGACAAVALAWRTGAEVRAPKPVRRWVPKRGGPVLRWLATRQVGGADWMWFYTAACAGTLWWMKGLVDLQTASLLDFAAVAWALHGGFKLMIGWTAVRALGNERDSGALEMLFVTPLGEVAVWHAWLDALKRRFLWPALGLVAFDMWLAWRWTFGESSTWSDSAMLPVAFLSGLMFLLDGYTLAWVGLWQGLVRRTATRATVRTLGLLLALPTLICLPLFGLLGSTAGSVPQQLWTATVWWFTVGCILDVLLGAWTMVRVSDDLRQAVLLRG
jgi:hypothetical protein